MHLPSSTYRIQFNKDFTFRDIQRILEYLHTLGISTVYASPIMRAVPGSLHGYDVTDSHEINPEIGVVEELKGLARELQRKDMFWLQDIVPNHMAFHTDNWRLMDVLERGPASPYYHYFDIDWDHPLPELRGRVMAPFLGKPLATCVTERELQLECGDAGMVLKYFETRWPLSTPAYDLIGGLLDNLQPTSPVVRTLQSLASAARGADTQEWAGTRTRLWRNVLDHADQRQILEDGVDRINADSSQLSAVIDRLFYRPAWWRDSDRYINYRRFFTVNELICLRMEDEAVFEDYHRTLLRLYRERTINGFRIDHIDGLNDPGRYTERLREAAGDACYIIAEKILEPREDMPGHWPMQGTSGYEFLSFLNQLLTYRRGARELLAFYGELVPDVPPYDELIIESKRNILTQYLQGEWDNLVRVFYHLGLDDGLAEERMKEALGHFMVCLPVYRIYPDQLPLRGESLVVLHEAFDQALHFGEDYATELQHLRSLFTETPKDAIWAARTLRFMKRVMQFTGPLTAKGVEDTTFYIYNPLISHDEVGDSPASLGISVEAFHKRMRHRQESTPLSLNTTATHDTKRGEDARIRIGILSRMPEDWRSHVRTWMSLNAEHRAVINGGPAPAPNDEYFIYQSMIGGFPEDFNLTAEWTERFLAYLVKAQREAKVHTNWSEPNEAYENACAAFVKNILDSKHGFLSSFTAFLTTVSEHANVYSLVQSLIKLTAPGIPDVYQGCELWDLSFVDPDNRRPVDYEKRMAFLFQLIVKEEKGYEAVMDYLEEHRMEGIEKLYVTWKVLTFRRANPTLFVEGEYIPLSVTGDEVLAAGYVRYHSGSWVAVVFPLGSAPEKGAGDDSPRSAQFVVFPDNAPDSWQNQFTGEQYRDTRQILLTDLFERFPVALLASIPA